MWATTFDPSDESAALPGEPGLILVFGETEVLRTSEVLGKLHARFPGAIQLGCSTCSPVSGSEIEETGLRALAMGFAATKLTLHTQQLTRAENSRAAGQALAASLAAPDLAGVLVLTVGLDVNGSGLIDGMHDVLGPDVPVSGGMAGDGARFGSTLVAVDGVAAGEIIAAVALHGDAIRIAHGCFGGWSEFGPRRVISGSSGTTLRTLDGKPALDLYESYLGPEAAELPASGLLYPLKIWDPANPGVTYVRTLLAIDRDARSLVLAGEIPQGWHAQLMRGSIDALVDGAEVAARQASEAMQVHGVEAQACLFVSCVGRRLLMGQRTDEEIEAVVGVIGSHVPLAGFYSYGEIAPQHGAAAGLHNQTVTLTLLAEAA